MSESLSVVGNSLPAPTPEALDKIIAAESRIMQMEQLPIQTEHVIHGGMYSRTVRLGSRVVIVGALVRVPTTLVVNGDTYMLAGDKWFHLQGYNVIPAKPGRKQIFVTESDTEITMTFATKAKTVEEAEAEFTEETEKLMSRREGEHDLVTITGEA